MNKYVDSLLKNVFDRLDVAREWKKPLNEQVSEWQKANADVEAYPTLYLF